VPGDLLVYRRFAGLDPDDKLTLLVASSVDGGLGWTGDGMKTLDGSGARRTFRSKKSAWRRSWIVL
jgi:hypothetical protein